MSEEPTANKKEQQTLPTSQQKVKELKGQQKVKKLKGQQKQQFKQKFIQSMKDVIRIIVNANSKQVNINDLIEIVGYEQQNSDIEEQSLQLCILESIRKEHAPKILYKMQQLAELIHEKIIQVDLTNQVNLKKWWKTFKNAFPNREENAFESKDLLGLNQHLKYEYEKKYKRTFELRMYFTRGQLESAIGVIKKE